jgi:hypothetical protein
MYKVAGHQFPGFGKRTAIYHYYGRVIEFLDNDSSPCLPFNYGMTGKDLLAKRKYEITFAICADYQRFPGLQGDHTGRCPCADCHL